MALRNPSRLPGTFRSRVFIGGSYRVPAGAASPRELLTKLARTVRASRLHPIIADGYAVAEPETQLHHDAIYLLHACRLAIFELSAFSGAMMEIERSADFGTDCLILYHDPSSVGWKLSRMLNSFVQEHSAQMRLYGYIDENEAKNAARNWLDEMLRLKHAKR